MYVKLLNLELIITIDISVFVDSIRHIKCLYSLVN